MKTAIRLAKKLSLPTGLFTCLGISVFLTSGCGILGEKEAASRTLAQDNAACLDEMGPLLESYLEGGVDEGKWMSTWNCVDDTIDMFKSFVQGSSATSYSTSDLRFLMQKFLFSKNPVTTELVDGVLAMKASLLGGSSIELTKNELEQYRGLVRFLRDETTRLIPHLYNRKHSPTADHLRAFADAVEGFGNRFADYLNTTNNQKISYAMGITFMREMAKAGSKMDPNRIEAWTRFGYELKYLFVKGANDGIAGADWTKLFKMGFKAGGAAIAFLEAKGDDPLFENEMIERIHSVLKSSLAEWNDAIPFTQLSRIVDRAPIEILPNLADDFRNSIQETLRPRTKITNGKSETFRPALARLFLTKTDTAIDGASIQRLVTLFRGGMRANWHLNNIYAGAKEELYPADFEALAKTYSAKLPNTTDKAEVTRLITIARRYNGLHPVNSAEILFEGQEKHTLNNLNRMSWYELAATSLLDSYGTSSDSFGKAAVLSDVTLLIDDLKSTLYSVGMIHPMKTAIDAKRFREANLFMPNGNGDDKMNLPETSVYIAYIFSAAHQQSRLKDLTLLGAQPCAMLGWNVPLKQPVYDIGCFRSRWLSSLKEMFSSMPRLLDDYNAMSQPERDEFYRTIETAAKITGYDDSPMTEFDLGSYAGLPHFAESVMEKFDMNGDNSIDRNETLTYVFPVFKRELASLSKIKIDFVNKAVILYLMQYGKQPEIMDLIKWAFGFEFLKKFNARRIRVYQIFSALSPPGAPDPISQTPPIGVQTSSALSFIANSLVTGLTATAAPSGGTGSFDISKVDPSQFLGYSKDGPIIDPASPYQEALEVLPQDL